MKLSDQQEEALSKIIDWYNNGKSQTFSLSGYAGTGKTKLANHVAQEVGVNDVVFVAYTAKAGVCLEKAGCRNVGTIHSLIYSLSNIEKKKRGLETLELMYFHVNECSRISDYKLVIVDEFSMISEDIARDLLKFGVKVLFMGDLGQLPPIKGEPYIKKPDIFLTEIIRQQEGSPIIELARMAREGIEIPLGEYGDCLVLGRGDKRAAQASKEADQILVGTNKRRKSCNQRVRKVNGYTESYPQKNEKVICLTNNPEYGLCNGEIYNIASDSIKVVDGIIRLDLDGIGHIYSYSHPFDGVNYVRDLKTNYSALSLEEENFIITCPPGSRINNFDFAYAITVHKSQGSSWDKVFIIDDYVRGGEYNKWLYTAITRAKKKLTIVRER